MADESGEGYYYNANTGSYEYGDVSEGSGNTEVSEQEASPTNYEINSTSQNTSTAGTSISLPASAPQPSDYATEEQYIAAYLQYHNNDINSSRGTNIDQYTQEAQRYWSQSHGQGATAAGQVDQLTYNTTEETPSTTTSEDTTTDTPQVITGSAAGTTTTDTTDTTDTASTSTTAIQAYQDLLAIAQEYMNTYGTDLKTALSLSSDDILKNAKSYATGLSNVTSAQSLASDYDAQLKEALSKSADEILASANKYASPIAATQAGEETNAATQSALRAAKAGGMASGQAALNAAQTAGQAYTQNYNDIYNKNLEAYQAQVNDRNTALSNAAEAYNSEYQSALEAGVDDYTAQYNANTAALQTALETYSTQAIQAASGLSAAEYNKWVQDNTWWLQLTSAGAQLIATATAALG